MLEEAVRGFVLADGPVGALVGSRMYPRKLPQGPVLPALVFQRVDTRRLHDLEGADGLPRCRLQVTCWATLPAGAAAVAEPVRVRLDGFRGAMGPVMVGSCLCVGERDLTDAEAQRYAVVLDFLIQYEEE
jgi:hypothetical protein